MVSGSEVKPLQNHYMRKKPLHNKPQRTTTSKYLQAAQCIESTELIAINYKKKRAQIHSVKELVRMRSPVRIRVAAPENPATVAVAGFFVYQRPRKNHDAGQGSPVRRRFAYARFQPPKPMHGVRPPPFGGGLRFPCRGKSICGSLPKPSVSDAFDRLSERACKPGSVIDSHLSRRTVAGAFQPPPWDGRAGHMSLRGVAPDRVYSAALSPAGE